jgi:hypothetical protein
MSNNTAKITTKNIRWWWWLKNNGFKETANVIFFDYRPVVRPLPPQAFPLFVYKIGAKK